MRKERCPNPHIIYFHLRKRLIDSMIMTFDSKDWRKLAEADSARGGLLGFFRRIFFGKEAKEYFTDERQQRLKMGDLVDEIFAIDGVTNVVLKQFELGIEKAEEFEWAEIEPKVVEILKKNGYDDEASQ